MVFVAEGEKDVDNLCRLGYCAASGENGAGPGKWLPAYTEQLRGMSVCILSDNDKVGRAYAAEAASALYGTASEVYVFDLRKVWPEIPEHGDVSDLISRFGQDKTIEMLMELTSSTEKWAPGEKEKETPDFFDGKHFLHNVMGDYMISHLGCCKINGALHVYDNGVYKPGESILHGNMIRLIPTITDAKRREVYKYIKDSLDTPERELSPPNLIPFKSSIYDIENDKFIPYTKDTVFLNHFPYDYNPDAPESKLVQDTLKEIACNDMDVVKLILESFGNCFYLLNSYRGSVMLYGQSGSNGKSTLLNMLTQMIGRENASFLSLQDTAERFRLIEVYGKAVNIGDDIPAEFLSDASTFKKLVTGETVIGERKGQDVIPFRPYAKMFFAANTLPPVSDKSRAFFGRLLLIPLNNDFSKDGKGNTSLKDRKWTDLEMEYLTRLSMEGLKRLVKQGGFTRPACVKEETERYELENNPVLGFLSDYTGEIEGQPTGLIYQRFRDWCYENGHKNIVTRRRFSNEICYRFDMESKNKRHPYFHGEPGKCFVAKERYNI